MYKLYWSPRTASQAIMAVLEEVGADYGLKLVDTELGQHRNPEFLAVNPNGLIPALTTADGRTMFESAAIILYLCDRHAEAGLSPDTNDADRAFYYQWLLYMADTVYPDYKRYYYPERYSAQPGDAERIRQRSVELLLADWKIVDDALAGQNWMLGARFSACDIYLHMLSTWFEPCESLYARYRNVARISAAVAERPAVARSLALHDR